MIQKGMKPSCGLFKIIFTCVFITTILIKTLYSIKCYFVNSQMIHRLFHGLANHQYIYSYYSIISILLY